MDEGPDTEVTESHGPINYRALMLMILVVIAISSLIAFAGHEWGVAHDCTTSGIKQDGQCGLATGIGDLFGFIGGGVFFVVSMTILVVGWQKANRK